jgi:hypothetical protein
MNLSELSNLNYLAFQFLDYERTWWNLFQKRIVHTKFMYVFITLPHLAFYIKFWKVECDTI